MNWKVKHILEQRRHNSTAGVLESVLGYFLLFCVSDRIEIIYKGTSIDQVMLLEGGVSKVKRSYLIEGRLAAANSSEFQGRIDYPQ